MTILDTIARHLTEKQQTVSCAESCTGGLLAAKLTSIAGSSLWFHEGFINYSNLSKQHRLGVSEQTLKQYGAVSRETVEEMAAGLKKLTGADYTLSISGIAGPDGGSPEKPVGTVWFGLNTPSLALQQTALFSGNREEVRNQAVAFALELLKQHLE